MVTTPYSGREPQQLLLSTGPMLAHAKSDSALEQLRRVSVTVLGYRRVLDRFSNNALLRDVCPEVGALAGRLAMILSHEGPESPFVEQELETVEVEVPPQFQGLTIRDLCQLIVAIGLQRPPLAPVVP